MSFPEPGTSVVGSQPEFCHSSVQAKAYLRSVAFGMKPNGPGASGLVHDSAVRALLPSVVRVEPVPTRVSHGAREARLPSTRSQGGVAPSCASQQPTMRLSVSEPSSGGLASKYFQAGFGGGFTALELVDQVPL